MDCIFCKIAAGEIPSSQVLENGDVVAFRDLNPEAPVHVLVIPRRHVTNLGASAAADQALLGAVLLAARQVAEQEGVAESGFRVVLNTHADAGQTVGHLHAHVLGGRRLGWPPG
jgi:histidine triad (HIT) family protein